MRIVVLPRKIKGSQLSIFSFGLDVDQGAATIFYHEFLFRSGYFSVFCSSSIESELYSRIVIKWFKFYELYENFKFHVIFLNYYMQKVKII